jgi:response regulator RpfG family c-di-GMP phosphodiesterase/DNA-directed RNA polymerase subunit RPC12/RpoP
MEITCKHCGSRFRAALDLPLTAPVRVACPSCQSQMVLKPAPAGAGASPAPPQSDGATGSSTPAESGELKPPAAIRRRKVAAIADEPRPFRSFLGEHLRRIGFDVTYFDTGESVTDFARESRADLVIVNVYLKGKLGVEVTEEIKADPAISQARIILIGALFRANRFRANPTNLYGADEYIEEQIPEKEFKQIIRKLFPELGPTVDMPVESREFDEARRLARLILSDIIIYHAQKVERGIRENTFFELLHDEITEGRQYYESRVPKRVLRDSEIFTETLQQFVQMKREELQRLDTGTNGS